MNPGCGHAHCDSPCHSHSAAACGVLEVMGSHVLQIFRQGVWAALTGGWYHDPHDSQFNNICHLYLWIFLLLLPLAMHLGLPPTNFTLCLYCVSTTILFAVIKLVSFRLHLMFDKGIRNQLNKSKEQPKQDGNVTNGHSVPGMKEDTLKDLKTQDIQQSHQDLRRNVSSDSVVIQTPDNHTEVKEAGAAEDVKENMCCERLSEKTNCCLEKDQLNTFDQNIWTSPDQFPNCQITRKKIIYEVTCSHPPQQESTVLQVLCGTTASMQHDTQTSKENSRPIFLMDVNQSAEYCETMKPKCASISDDTDLNSEEETSGNHGLFSHDPEEESQASVVTAKPSRCGTPYPISQKSENSFHVISETSFPKKQFYKFRIFPGKWIKVWCDRMTLLALLDKTENVGENILAILLAIVVSLFGFLVLQIDVFRDIWIFQFCFVIASCQFCLLKSVQPDPASPVHGYNQIITYSRPVYFCIFCGLILLLDSGAKLTAIQPTTVYGFHLFTPDFFQTIRDHIIVFVSCFPIISLFGLFPQVNTFCVYFLEQIDILIFGGTATTGFGSSIYSLLRSTLAVVMLYGICSYSIKETWDIRHIPSMFSAFCGLLVALSYHLSRQSSDPTVIMSYIKCRLLPENLISSTKHEDPLPEQLKSSMPILSTVLLVMALTVGLLAHYIIPQLRKHHPWLWIAHPLLQNKEYRQREIIDAAQLMWFEKIYVCLVCFEKYFLYPSIILNAVTTEAFSVSGFQRFGKQLDAFIIAVSGMKLMRSCFCNPSQQYITLGFTVILFQFDYSSISESFLLDFYVISIMFYKIWDLLQKLQYVFAYIAPWQIAWGSSFHVFAQFFAVPHSGMLLFQTFATSIFSSSLSPFLGSVIFIASYPRPIKYWEGINSTKRLDIMNTRLQHQIEKDPGNDNDNLNSIFYEHLARSLQHSLCGDLTLGRWGNYASGDCFILVSDYLNAFVHLIETGNGFITFQLRGLEFKGTYCHQREVEAITEGDEDNTGCCCFQIGHLPHVLSCNAAFNLRWLTWEIARSQYILEGYSVIYTNAASLFQVFDLRKILIKYFVKSIIYFTVKSPKLLYWLKDESMQKALQPFTRWNHVVYDMTIFNINVDEDYIPCLQGITRASFCGVYLDWIQYCAKRETKKVGTGEDSFLVTLCFGLCILGRRLLAAAAHHMPFSLDAFLHGLHTLFKGHYQISKEEEWVFADMDLLHTVISPAIRMALKLHQSQFACPEEYEDPLALHEAIKTFGEKIVICDEEDPAWRSAILSNKKELLTLRHVVEDGTDEYSVIMLHKSYLNFKLIKVNKECVRGLWAGQQQELIFLRNRDHERGSIQNNQHVLRNLINSSCDQPLGYPIYVSPLTTSYLGTHSQLKKLLGGPINFDIFTSWFQTKWLLMKKDYDRSHNDGSINEDANCEGGLSSVTINSESNNSESCRNSLNASHAGSGTKSLEKKKHQTKGKRKYRSQSAYTHSSLNQIHVLSSLSGPNVEKCNSSCTDNYKDVKRLSSSHHCLTNSSRSQYAPTVVSPASAVRNINEQARELHQSGQTSSTNSTLSLLFGKKGFSSALVLSGLSAADGDNTADTLSSSSVNIVVCSHSRAADQSTENIYRTVDIDGPTDAGRDSMNTVLFKCIMQELL
ncbi:pecanex-like protein 2 isoform X3 [Hyla sarda]|uniref:pecanex-like protein 2 isoform X3 n=1 Tax=Hyla sarda TaxID=327740 RepID=UPI0024C25682|nr:pecanex-like protein 2 isoform X3 [Hyla sarda]